MHAHCSCARKRPSPALVITSQTGTIQCLPKSLPCAVLISVAQTRLVGYLGVMQHIQARGDQFISSLLLTHLLQLADHGTRLLAHLVCQRCNTIPWQPTCPGLREPLPMLHLHKDKVSPAGTAICHVAQHGWQLEQLECSGA